MKQIEVTITVDHEGIPDFQGRGTRARHAFRVNRLQGHLRIRGGAVSLHWTGDARLVRKNGELGTTTIYLPADFSPGRDAEEAVLHDAFLELGRGSRAIANMLPMLAKDTDWRTT